MNYDELGEVADKVLAIRAEWTRGGIINALQQLPTLPYDIAKAHALRIAQDLTSATPAMIYLRPVLEPQPTGGRSKRDSQDSCDICGLTEKNCGTAQENQLAIGADVATRHGRAQNKELVDSTRHRYTAWRPKIVREPKHTDVISANIPSKTSGSDIPWLPPDLEEQRRQRWADLEQQQREGDGSDGIDDTANTTDETET